MYSINTAINIDLILARLRNEQNLSITNRISLLDILRQQVIFSGLPLEYWGSSEMELRNFENPKSAKMERRLNELWVALDGMREGVYMPGQTIPHLARQLQQTGVTLHQLGTSHEELLNFLTREKSNPYPAEFGHNAVECLRCGYDTSRFSTMDFCDSCWLDEVAKLVMSLA